MDNEVIATVGNMKRYYDKVPGLTMVSNEGEEYSACQGDYWDLPDEYTFRNEDGTPMLLAVQVTKYVSPKYFVSSEVLA